MSNNAVPYHLATMTPQGLMWLTKRNCAATPALLCGVFLGLCVVSLVVATFFWLMGAVLVLPFALLEVAALGVALVVYSRHATDSECVRLKGSLLAVECERGGRHETEVFNREWVRVATAHHVGGLVELTGQGRSVVVGRHLRPELRGKLAREIQRALWSEPFGQQV